MCDRVIVVYEEVIDLLIQDPRKVLVKEGRMCETSTVDTHRP